MTANCNCNRSKNLRVVKKIIIILYKIFYKNQFTALVKKKVVYLVVVKLFNAVDVAVSSVIEQAYYLWLPDIDAHVPAHLLEHAQELLRSRLVSLGEDDKPAPGLQIHLGIRKLMRKCLLILWDP